MTFQLDTSGRVDNLGNGRRIPRRVSLVWSDLSPFAQGYIEALFADLPGLDDQGRMIPRHPDVVPGVHVMGFSDLAPETLARIIADCEFYQNHNPALWSRVSDKRARDFGRDFWRLRQNGNLPQQSPLTVQLGVDGKVRF